MLTRLRYQGRECVHKSIGVHSLELDGFVFAGFALDDGNARRADTERLRQKFDAGLVGRAVHRRRGQFDFQAMVVDSENLVARRPRLNSRRKLNARLVGFEFKGHESDRIGLYLFRASVKDLVAALRLLIKYVLSVFRRRISPWRWLTSALTFRLCRSASSRAWFTNFRAFS